MSLYEITLIIQRIQEPVGALAERLSRFMTEQRELPVFCLPDMPPGQEPLQLELKRLDLYLHSVIEAPDRATAQHGLERLCERIDAEVCQSASACELAGFIGTELTRMELDQVLQGPDHTFAVYRHGAIFALTGEERIDQLEDPFSPLFGPEGLYKLSEAESRVLLNNRQYTPIWSRRGALRKHFRGSDNWYARHA